jgi:hypothetical protein
MSDFLVDLPSHLRDRLINALEPGNFVKKPMSACTGREIMTEIVGH